jgi:DNA-binding HxlR family transcriptional regulator
MTGIGGGTVAKKASRGVSVKLPEEIVDRARIVASLLREEIQSLLTEILDPRLKELEEEALRRRLEGRPQVRRRRKAEDKGEDKA